MRLLAMSGFIPEQICDIVRFTGYTGERNISHYCGYASDFISQVINDESIDGAVFPKSCDSSRIMQSYLSDCKKFIYQINIPARNDFPAVDFLAEELRCYRHSLEETFGESLGDINGRIEEINVRNRMIADCYESLEFLSYGEYLRKIHEIMSAPLFCGKEISASQISRKKTINHRVYLVGSFLCNSHIADIIEANGLGIVGDNLPESGRIQGNIIKTRGIDTYRAVAENILDRRLSPTQNNFAHLMDMDLNEIKNVGAEAVIFITQKYCEPYDYLYSIYKKRLEREEIPALRLSIANSEDENKVNLSVEAFADML